MLVDGVKWACGPCVRGHRVNRTLIRINRKGRPFVTCSVCNETPCPKPREHYKVQHSSRVKKTKPAPEVTGSARKTSPAGLLPVRTRRVYPLHLDLLKYRTPYLLYSPLIVFLTCNKSVYPSVLMLQGELAINCPV
ncbi:hypothetical protein BDV35DRAFT_271957 [Aspergillus flavus]|uniref:Copper-fist domain-containing protein n=1 Tax=Aspergillus flavus TaxID=5059 RepID=A0A5N6GUX6_ASPFL|nr:hypothetical protein BDV35DRAFT_271957 [Aspergillus flavus]